jgi:hypothetical protein
MKSIKFIAFATVAAMLPMVVLAESAADVAYCKAMVAKYLEYNTGADPAGNYLAIVYTCQTKPSEAIPILEKELKDDKIALPVR